MHAPFVVAMAQAPGQQNILIQMLPFAAMLGIFYFLVLRPMRNRQKAVETFQAGLKVGDRVITTSGIYGTITKLNEKSVKLQIADRLVIEIARAGVGGLQGQDPVVPVNDGQNSNL